MFHRLEESCLLHSSPWSCFQVSQVSRAAQMAVPTPRTLSLAKPRPPAILMEEWDPMPKPKPYVSDYNRLLQLASEWLPSCCGVAEEPAGWRPALARAVPSLGCIPRSCRLVV